MSYQITRKIEFDAGHRLVKHESKCRNVHGHRYTAEITVEAAALDDCGRVIDFGAIKEIVGGWVDEKWDHGFLMERGDPIAIWLEANAMKAAVLDFPPTAENLAQELLRVAYGLLRDKGIRVVRVRLWETPNCYADAFAQEPVLRGGTALQLDARPR